MPWEFIVKLSLSVRIAEAACKTKLNVGLDEIIRLAVENGYEAICMRASAGGVQTPIDELFRMRMQIEAAGLVVSMVTADFDVPLNNEDGPNSLREIGPSLDAAAALDCDLIRVCLKTRDDISRARESADRAAERGIRLTHQCHTTTLFEQIEPILDVLQQIDRDNFGVIYEPANLMLCGEPYDVSAMERLNPYLMNAYVQNHRLDPDGPESLETWCRGVVRFHHIPLWEAGGVDFAASVAGLKAIGYDGYLTVHQHYAHIMGPDEAAIESARYLRGLIEQESERA
ncbi:MAG: xylose isomerase [Planctomycetaceae bacterium]|nr:xylose isomerase [Planctomycetaceae bacterium]